ncbi:hypothetical protein GDO81_001094 [Engystomops pustulosus]|uniref:Uncharacterized protein n=1 Tax=Engystomops pustulosus TaxID=76066 RepID=A0AAV7D9K7_ENGPU|nr:hypothetical protein GDO81_001094 [Engystomops pustulosus]
MLRRLFYNSIAVEREFMSNFYALSCIIIHSLSSRNCNFNTARFKMQHVSLFVLTDYNSLQWVCILLTYTLCIFALSYIHFTLYFVPFLLLCNVF